MGFKYELLIKILYGGWLYNYIFYWWDKKNLMIGILNKLMMKYWRI